jgi:deazaflavin-dependent oxidoreductase (nitroreductase family)
MKPYRMSPGRRAINAVVRPLARLGLTGPRTYLLTVPGRKTGTLWSTPVSIVKEGDVRWLVAPFGDRNWVKNARAAGWVELRRGRTHERLLVEELPPEPAVPVLQEYFRRGRVTRPFFEVRLRSSREEWLSEAPRHPVFKLRSE